MRNKFIILVQHETAKETQDFAAYLTGEKYGWWHRTQCAWIVRTPEAVTANHLRDMVRIYFPNRRVLVMEIEENDWAAWGKPTEFAWFNK